MFCTVNKSSAYGAINGFKKPYQKQHSHKKRKDSLETQAVLLIFSPELEIFGMAVQSIHQNSKKWQLLLETAQ